MSKAGGAAWTVSRNSLSSDWDAQFPSPTGHRECPKRPRLNYNKMPCTG